LVLKKSQWGNQWLEVLKLVAEWGWLSHYLLLY
jgi:hypothetical protein